VQSNCRARFSKGVGAGGLTTGCRGASAGLHPRRATARNPRAGDAVIVGALNASPAIHIRIRARYNSSCVRYWEGQMNRKVVSASLFFWALLGSQGLAQERSALKLGNCSQSMIAGTWQTILSAGQGVDNATDSFACPINIAADGTATAGNCTLLPGMSFVLSPSGTLKIDNTCHVTGSISYNSCIGTTCRSVALVISAWRSADGSRITGFQQWTCIASPGQCLTNFELIAGH
jgi:hypothetical protein